jgi:hypothetical protein
MSAVTRCWRTSCTGLSARTTERRSFSGNPKGDSVKITMSGKFLPFKYYGATGNALAYGLKEE